MSEVFLQGRDQRNAQWLILNDSELQGDAYKQAMAYATSSVVHYHKLVPEGFKSTSPTSAALYERFLTMQQTRIIITYRQLVLGELKQLDDLKLADYRAELFQQRETLKSELIPEIAGETVRGLVKINTAFFVNLTERLWLQAIALSQKKPPCKYALLSLGSMSKFEMCPYSDLEFALLIEKEDPPTYQYFQPIVRLMQLLVIGLGETPLMIAAQEQFSATVTGYHFDPGGNTPLYEGFMATPKSLANLQHQPGEALTITRNILRTTGLITGDEPLHKDYQLELDKALSEKFNLSGHYFFATTIERYRLQALEILEGALPEFSPSSLTTRRHVRGVNQLHIKTDLYRLPTQIVDSLSLYYNVNGKTTFEKLENLEKNNIVHHHTGRQLKNLLETALKFRVITHLHYGTEEESVAYEKDEKAAVLLHEPPVYVLSKSERETLLRLYQILVSLESNTRLFVVSKGKNNPFKKRLIYFPEELAQHPALQHHLKARSYEQLFPPKKALRSYLAALQLDPDNIEILLNYVSYLYALCEMHERNQTKAGSTAKEYKEYQDDIDKRLNKIAVVLLIPNQKGQRECAPIVAVYRRLPFGLRAAFRKAIVRQQEEQAAPLDQLSNDQIEQDLTFFTLLLKTLNEEPDEAGQRESWQEHKRLWKATLACLVDQEAEEKNSVYIASPFLGQNKKQVIRYPLKLAIQNELLNETFAFKTSTIHGSEHRVVRLSVKQPDGSSKQFYCKAYPEMPGMTYLIERLHYQLIGHGTCLSELVKLERPNLTSIPVLLSEGIFGPTLDEVLKKEPERLQNLDHRAYSELVFLAILTNPEDGLPTNYIVTPTEAGKGSLTLVSIDHDHALFPPYVLEPVKAGSVESRPKAEDEDAAEETHPFKPRLQVKTILFCLEAMHQPVNPHAKEALLKLTPAKVIANVLREAQVQNEYYCQLFDEETIKAFHESRANRMNFLRKESKNTAENCTIPIPLKEGDAIKLYQKLRRLQQFLTNPNHQQATLLQCLLHVEPHVGMAYAGALKDYKDPLERLLQLGEYPLNVQKQMVTSSQAMKSLHIHTHQIGAERYVDLKDLTPAQGLAELDLITYQQDTLKDIQTEVGQGNFRRFITLKASEHKAAVISGTGPHSEEIAWDKLNADQQSALLKLLAGIPFQQLNLSGCKALTQEQLIQLLNQSPDCTVLNLSEHPTFDGWWLRKVAMHAPRLKKLTIRNTRCLIQHGKGIARFNYLIKLDMANNPSLQVIDLKAPKLKFLQIKNCPQLHTLKVGSKHLREVDVSQNGSLRPTQEVGYPDSAYTLSSLKLSGTPLPATQIEALSAYPFLLLCRSLSETGQSKAMEFLDYHLERTRWVDLPRAQKADILSRIWWCEPEFRPTGKDPGDPIQTATQQALAASAVPSAEQHSLLNWPWAVINGVLQQVTQPILAYTTSFLFNPLSPKQDSSLDQILAQVTNEKSYLRQGAHQALSGYLSTPSVNPSPEQRQAILKAFLVGTCDEDGNVQEVARRALLRYPDTVASLEHVLLDLRALEKDKKMVDPKIKLSIRAMLIVLRRRFDLEQYLSSQLSGKELLEKPLPLGSDQDLSQPSGEQLLEQAPVDRSVRRASVVVPALIVTAERGVGGPTETKNPEEVYAAQSPISRLDNSEDNSSEEEKFTPPSVSYGELLRAQGTFSATSDAQHSHIANTQPSNNSW